MEKEKTCNDKSKLCFVFNDGKKQKKVCYTLGKVNIKYLDKKEK